MQREFQKLSNTQVRVSHLLLHLIFHQE